MKQNRRDFLKTAGVAGAVAVTGAVPALGQYGYSGMSTHDASKPASRGYAKGLTLLTFK